MSFADDTFTTSTTLTQIQLYKINIGPHNDLIKERTYSGMYECPKNRKTPISRLYIILLAYKEITDNKTFILSILKYYICLHKGVLNFHIGSLRVTKNFLFSLLS